MFRTRNTALAEPRLAIPAPFVRVRMAVSVFFFISGFNFAAWASRIPFLQKELQLNDAQLGTLLTALPSGLMLTMPLAGLLLNRWSSKSVLIISSITYSILLCLLGLCTNEWEAGIIMFLFGASRNFFNISVNTQSIGVQTLYRHSIVTSFHGIWSLAALAGAGVSSLLMSFHVSTLNHFVLVGGISILLIVLTARYVVPADGEKKAASAGFVWPDKPLLTLGVVGFVSMVCEGIMSDWSGVYFHKIVGVPEGLINVGYICYLGAMVTGRFAGDWLVNKFGIKHLLQLSSIMISTGFVLAVVFPFIVPAALGFLMVGFGVSCVMPLVFSATPRLSKLPRGVAVAAISTISYLGFLTGPPIIGYVAHALNLRASFVLGALTALVIFFIVNKMKTLRPNEA